MAKQKPWQSDEEFEMLLRQSLTAIQPPADFSSRVMAAVAQEKQQKAAAPQVVPFSKTGNRQARRLGCWLRCSHYYFHDRCAYGT